MVGLPGLTLSTLVHIKVSQHFQPWLIIYTGTRAQYMSAMHKEMEQHVAHDSHVIYHKEQIRALLENFKQNEIVIKADFIQNISHIRGRETSASFYSKRQTQFLSFVIWYKVKENNVVKTKKIFVDYLSSYLKHNSLFFSKCVTHLLTYLRDQKNITFNKVCC